MEHLMTQLETGQIEVKLAPDLQNGRSRRGRHHPGRRPLPAHQRPPPAARWFSLALAGLSNLRLILRR